MRASPPRRRTRVAAYALCVEDGALLLCRMGPNDPDTGQWTLPGGGVHFQEAPADAVLRELDEETGLQGAITGLREVLSWATTFDDGEEFHAIQIVYDVRITGGELRDETDGSTDAARWFSAAELVDLPLADLAATAVGLVFD
jgi:ADP-ribose pyrophosphatase YjhB (NUDIX family)